MQLNDFLIIAITLLLAIAFIYHTIKFMRSYAISTKTPILNFVNKFI